MKLRYTLKQFDDHTFTQTETTWKSGAQELVQQGKALPSHFESPLAFAREHRNYENKGANPCFAYGIFEEDSDSATAILEFVYANEGKKWLKMLDLSLSPKDDLATSDESDTDAVKRLAEISTAAVMGALGLTGVHKSKILKLYARYQSAYLLFTFVSGMFANMGETKHVRVQMQGRWLVFSL